jgi:hypothetical protein
MNTPNPYAPPQATVADVAAPNAEADIAGLPVSDGWKARFYLIRRAGGPAMKQINALSFSERMKITFNILGFLLGPLYYLAKGMWRKAISLFGVCVLAAIALDVLLSLLHMAHLGRAMGLAFGALWAVRANIDYYKKMVLKDNGWW